LPAALQQRNSPEEKVKGFFISVGDGEMVLAYSDGGKLLESCPDRVLGQVWALVAARASARISCGVVSLSWPSFSPHPPNTR